MNQELLKGRVTSVEGDIVTIVLNDGQEIRVPAQTCIGTPSDGCEIRLLIAVPGAEDAARSTLSRALLNELLSSNADGKNE